MPETIEILRGLRDKYEAHHKVTITDEAIVAAASLSDRYITDRFLPDKAIDLIDEAASRARLDSCLLYTSGAVRRQSCRGAKRRACGKGPARQFQIRDRPHAEGARGENRSRHRAQKGDR